MEVMVASTKWKARDEDRSSNRRGTNSTEDELQEHNYVGPMCNHTHTHTQAGRPTSEDLDYDVLRVWTSRKQRGGSKLRQRTTKQITVLKHHDTHQRYPGFPTCVTVGGACVMMAYTTHGRCYPGLLGSE